jgi:hypothetical protein
VRRVGLGLIKPVLGILPDDWEWLRLPVYQTAPND